MCTIIESDAASHLNLSSPIPYRKIRSCVRNVNFGINFAGVVLLDSLKMFMSASSGDLDPISERSEGKESECTGNFSSS